MPALGTVPYLLHRPVAVVLVLFRAFGILWDLSKRNSRTNSDQVGLFLFDMCIGDSMLLIHHQEGIPVKYIPYKYTTPLITHAVSRASGGSDMVNYNSYSTSMDITCIEISHSLDGASSQSTRPKVRSKI
jgi:hypothetical protein